MLAVMAKDINFHEKYGREVTSSAVTSNRKFGIIFAFTFLLLLLTFYKKNMQLNLFLLFVSLLFFTLSIFWPKSLSPLNEVWRLIGIALQKIMSPFILAFLYFFVFTPTALFLKLTKKDILELKFEPSKESYWIRSSDIQTNMKDQF